jgi:predicted AlkP superfamily pyrophosphatase or phosphodiesterase
MTWLQRSVIWFGMALVVLTTPAQAAPTIPPQERTVILVSLDGFRWDYLQKFQPINLLRLAKEGVQAERLIPVFPSLTFPNHYTLVTGLYPEHHGIIGNNFYDPTFKAHYNAFNAVSSESRWWGGEPIWATAIKQGRTAKCMFWPGSQAEIGGVRPTEWKPFSKNTTFTECVDTVLGWLDATNKRPSFVTLYFHEPDSAGHRDGLDSPKLAEAVGQVDAAVGRLVDGIQGLKLNDAVNLVIVSDHGMAELSPDRVITLGDVLDMSKVQVDFSGAVAGLRPLDGNAEALYSELKKREIGFRVFRREQMPERFHFRDNDRIPPLVLVANEGWQITQRTAAEQAGRTVLKATHGFDPELPSMGGLFIAHGPAFQSGVTIPPLENVHVYNLLCATIGLKPAPNDGDDRLATKVLLK